ncbi:cell division protein ZapE [Hyphobacterium sp. HN65]|uniref:Cell division protein ZapE n=1 Tax=Hyphobacterium lacteum TaxID=3116575 RepID=A0ABU7LSQ7_9PROT|nr:cell division protein ZapE [Hyphobacterium sp. HN65]MEE2526927.1 cell division protein ZapE [Hyphobacterium sp. HN65]
MTPLEALQARIDAGDLTRDEGQLAAAAALSELHRQLAGWRIQDGWFRHKTPPPKGLYLWGGVGRGKSMLMDLFFERAPIRKKRRVHFHQFMQETHARIGAWRKRQDRKRGKDDPIPPVAQAIADEARLLCFDEFQVTDIADAMLLGRLFDSLFEIGVVVVATSNRVPDDLYKDGINRQLFLPFIDRLKETLDVMEIASGEDHRLRQLTAAPVYYSPLDPAADEAMESAWSRLTQGARPQACTISVQGREVEVPKEAAGVARFTFEELCARPLGPADYLQLAARFHTLLVERVPRLSPEKRNEAKRFVTLIDAVYEAKTKLVMSADAEPDDLYPAGDGAFEFERTASRLIEMRTEEYLSAAHEDAIAEGEN